MKTLTVSFGNGGRTNVHRSTITAGIEVFDSSEGRYIAVGEFQIFISGRNAPQMSDINGATRAFDVFPLFLPQERRFVLCGDAKERAKVLVLIDSRAGTGVQMGHISNLNPRRAQKVAFGRMPNGNNGRHVSNKSAVELWALEPDALIEITLGGVEGARFDLTVTADLKIRVAPVASVPKAIVAHKNEAQPVAATPRSVVALSPAEVRATSVVAPVAAVMPAVASVSADDTEEGVMSEAEARELEELARQAGGRRTGTETEKPRGFSKRRERY